MPTEKNDIEVQIACDCQILKVDLDRFEDLARGICKRFNVKKAAISIAIVDDDTITQINTKFLNHKTQTDVISFDLSDSTDEPKNFELVVNAEQAVRQAEKRGHSTEAELALYITHGLLHNLGFDDADPQFAQKMHSTEDEILQQAGFGIVYGNAD
jgi:probable rRNA maturation factor